MIKIDKKTLQNYTGVKLCMTKAVDYLTPPQLCVDKPYTYRLTGWSHKLFLEKSGSHVVCHFIFRFTEAVIVNPKWFCIFINTRCIICRKISTLILAL